MSGKKHSRANADKNVSDGSQSDSTLMLTLGAIGIVFGDIGTSPIYALRETVRAAAGNQRIPDPADIIGALSIIIWALTVVVTVKYALIVLKADNDGEGGTLSIMALADRVSQKRRWLILLLGTLGASLFYGDAVITPAISVLSAVEGLEVAAPAISHMVLPLTAVILIGLFMIQRFGTGKVSVVFGPLTLLWFLLLGLSGAVHVFENPVVLLAINPVEAAGFLLNHSDVALAVIGASFLAVTGVEALYVDLSHFGRKPILLAWFSLIFPCLLLNYFGQAAWLLESGAPIEQPLFQMLPEFALVPMVVFATIATVIASQAVISGAFSLTRQAVQLGLLPRFRIIHTSATQSGQIYLPQLNWIMLCCVLLLVFGFGSSERLASAYGISVTGEMLVTTLLLTVVMVAGWRKSYLLTAIIIIPFVLLESTFLMANIMKIPNGGWVSVVIAAIIFMLIRIWSSGCSILAMRSRNTDLKIGQLSEILAREDVPLVSGTAVFFVSDAGMVPTAMLHSLKHFKVLHEKNIVLTVEVASQPVVPLEERLELKRITNCLYQAILHFGFMESPEVPKALKLCREKELDFNFNPIDVSYFLTRRSFKVSPDIGLPVWQDRIFIAMTRNAADVTSYYYLPTNRVIEIGAPTEI